MAKWIRFVEIVAPGVTKRWNIVATQGDVVIGRICWSNGWRRYVLQPGYPTEWEQDCLRDVAEFLETQTREHKAGRALASRVPAAAPPEVLPSDLEWLREMAQVDRTISDYTVSENVLYALYGRILAAVEWCKEHGNG